MTKINPVEDSQKNVSSQSPLRFYEGLCEPFPHEPTRNDLDIVQSGDMGQGVIARRAFTAGEIVFKFFGPVLKEQTLRTLQLAPGVYVEDPIVMGKVLHSCAPNMVCDVQERVFSAVRDISAGEYLTMDYNSTEDELFRPFECHCGAENCHGFIQGRLIK